MHNYVKLFRSDLYFKGKIRDTSTLNGSNRSKLAYATLKRKVS